MSHGINIFHFHPTNARGGISTAGRSAVGLANSSIAVAAESPVGLGTAASYAVLAGTTVENTGPSVISGSVGVHGGSAVTGFPPGIVTNGTIHAADVQAAQAKADLTTAYLDAAGRATTAAVGADLVGQTLVGGVYTGVTLGLTGTLTLDAQGDVNAVWVFQAADTLITSSASTVSLVNGAQACNVFWQVGSSATLGTNSVFVGTVMALTAISAQTGATIQGRLLARNAAVTLDNNVITAAGCAPVVIPSSSSSSSVSPSSTSSASSSSSATAVPTSSSSVLPTSGGPVPPVVRGIVPTTPQNSLTSPITTTPSNPVGNSAVPSTPQGGTTTSAYGQGSGGGSGSGSGGGSGIDTNTDYLAATGTHTTPMIGAGVLALTAGFLLLLAGQQPGRHRRARHFPTHRI